MRYWLFALILLAVCVFGCKTISQKAQDDLAKPIDCSTAREDIAALEAEKASVTKQGEAGVGMVLPGAAVIGILSGDYSNRVKVASGEYNRDIEAKIMEIKCACGID
jgi:hypothetical protein